MLEAGEPVGLAWVTLLGFIRLATHPRLAARPLSVDAACNHIHSWLEQPQVTPIAPGPEHARILCRLLAHVGSAANLTTDAHLAALAIEHQALLHSSDADFARFPDCAGATPCRNRLCKDGAAALAAGAV